MIFLKLLCKYVPTYNLKLERVVSELLDYVLKIMQLERYGNFMMTLKLKKENNILLLSFLNL